MAKPQLPASLSKWLKANKGGFAEAAAAAASAPDYDRLPDGRYMARLSSAEVTESAAGDPMVAWAYVVSAPEEQAGQIIRKYDGLIYEKSFFYLSKELRRYGIDPTGIELPQVPEILADLADAKPMCVLQLKTKPNKNDPEGEPYQNVWLNRVKEDGDEIEEEAEAETEEAEEAAEEEEEAPAEVEEETPGMRTLEVGMEVEYPWEGNPETLGTVREIDEENGKAKVASVSAKTGKTVLRWVDFSDMVLHAPAEAPAEEEEEEEAPAPPPAPASTRKPPAGKRPTATAAGKK
jgi:hypothetical protein